MPMPVCGPWGSERYELRASVISVGEERIDGTCDQRADGTRGKVKAGLSSW